MASVFSKIIAGELPGHFVWRDEYCVAFLSIAPLQPGHVLVVPRVEVEHWIDLDPEVWQHITSVSQTLGTALQRAFNPIKVGVMLAGLEVPHVHIHLVPIRGVHDLDFANADDGADAEALADSAERVRQQLRAMNREGVSDG